MSTADHLLRAILDEPAEDLHRLAYADWLEEHGVETEQVRGEFIRLQLELARLLPVIEGHITNQEPLRALIGRRVPLPAVFDLKHQQRDDSWITIRGLRAVTADWFDTERDLVTFEECPHRRKVHQREYFAWLAGRAFWCSGLPGDARNEFDWWRRGFVYKVVCPLAWWLEHGPALVAVQPIERVELSDPIEASSSVMGFYLTRALIKVWCLAAARDACGPHNADDAWGHWHFRADLLADPIMAAAGMRYWPSQAEANEQVGAACLTWAKAEARRTTRNRRKPAVES